MKTQTAIRASFFEITGYPRQRKNGRSAKHNDYNATIRSTFCQYIDSLHRSGIISASLANRATL